MVHLDGGQTLSDVQGKYWRAFVEHQGGGLLPSISGSRNCITFHAPNLAHGTIERMHCQDQIQSPV